MFGFLFFIVIDNGGLNKAISGHFFFFDNFHIGALPIDTPHPIYIYICVEIQIIYTASNKSVPFGKENLPLR